MRAVEFIVERKKRRRRPGYAAYGPGPYGGYGYYAGYSGDSGEGGGDLGEKINPKTLTRGFVQEKDMGWYTLQAVGDFASRMADEPPTMEIYAMLKPEAGKRDGKQIGQLSLKIAQGIFLKDNPGAEALVAGGVIVDAAYKRKGVASSMYQFAKELGNDVIASIDQSDDAVAMWKGMQAKGMQAKGVAEGLIDYAQRKLGLKWGKIGDVVNGSVVAEYLDSQDDSMDTDRYINSKFKLINITANEAEKYREISDLNGWPSDTPLEKVKGWGIDNYKMDRIRKNDVTYQSLMKHTPVVSSRGFIINGNHRVARALEMGIDTIPILKELQQGVDENFADGRNPQDKGDAKRHGVNTKASVSSLRKTAKQGGRKGQLAHWLANMKAGRAKKNK